MWNNCLPVDSCLPCSSLLFVFIRMFAVRLSFQTDQKSSRSLCLWCCQTEELVAKYMNDLTLALIQTLEQWFNEQQQMMTSLIHFYLLHGRLEVVQVNPSCRMFRFYIVNNQKQIPRSSATCEPTNNPPPPPSTILSSSWLYLDMISPKPDL